MDRLTSKNYHEMGMHQLALNQVYIGSDGWVRYLKGPDEECSVCDLIRDAAEALNVELPIFSDEELSDLLADLLQYGEEEPEGILAILYRALWAMAELRARLAAYEDTGLEPAEVAEYQHLCESYVQAGLDAKFVQACIDAVKNDPLTLEELRGMDGEPVWIERCGSDSPEDGTWALVFVEGGFCRTSVGGIAFFALYGIGWLAYRRKPEEGRHDLQRLAESVRTAGR